MAKKNKKQNYQTHRFITVVPHTLNPEDVAAEMRKQGLRIQHIPITGPLDRTPHKTTPLAVPGSNGFLVYIDTGIAALMRRLWMAGIVTYYCCEGYDVPQGKDAYARKYEGHRAYVMFKDEPTVREWLALLLTKWSNTSFNSAQRFTIETDEGPRVTGQGPRITLRFPKADIGKLCDMTDFFVDEQRREMPQKNNDYERLRA